MVRALREARRVLRPGGLVIDLRPGLQHRRVSLVRAGQAQPVGVMRETFDYDHAANRAVARIVGRAGGRAGSGRGGRAASPSLRFVGRTRLNCDRVMDGLDDFTVWVDDFVRLGDRLPPHDWLVERVRRALARQPGRAQVVVAGPLEMRVLRKPEP